MEEHKLVTAEIDDIPEKSLKAIYPTAEQYRLHLRHSGDNIA